MAIVNTSVSPLEVLPSDLKLTVFEGTEPQKSSMHEKFWKEESTEPVY